MSLCVAEENWPGLTVSRYHDRGKGLSTLRDFAVRDVLCEYKGELHHMKSKVEVELYLNQQPSTEYMLTVCNFAL